jgi:ribosomal protein L20A (L18A)
LFEAYSSKTPTDPNQIVDNKVTLLEGLTKQPINEQDVKDDVIKELENSDKDVRLLTYRVLLEKFNTKYDDLSSNQKKVLQEFITSVDSTSKLKDFYNVKINEIKSILDIENKKVKSKPTQIKIDEVAKLLNELDKNDKVSDDNLVDLLQYYQLTEEIVKANVKV